MCINSYPHLPLFYPDMTLVVTITRVQHLFLQQISNRRNRPKQHLNHEDSLSPKFQTAQTEALSTNPIIPVEDISFDKIVQVLTCYCFYYC